MNSCPECGSACTVEEVPFSDGRILLVKCQRCSWSRERLKR